MNQNELPGPLYRKQQLSLNVHRLSHSYCYSISIGLRLFQLYLFFNSLNFFKLFNLDSFGSEIVTRLCPCRCKAHAHRFPMIPAPVINIFFPTLMGLARSQPWDKQDNGSHKAATKNRKIIIFYSFNKISMIYHDIWHFIFLPLNYLQKLFKWQLLTLF